MKKFAISLILLLIIITITVINYITLTKTSEQIIDLLDEVIDVADNKKYAEEKLNVLFEKIEKHKNFYYISLNHENMDMVIEKLVRAKGYLDNNQLNDFLVELKVIRNYIINFTELESISLSNIF